MLGIHGVGGDGADYYLSDPALELPAHVAPSWIGAAAAGLGLEGVLRPADFERLLRGDLRPGSGPGGRSARTSVAAYDLTFSAPKSASVLFALGGRDVANGVVAVHLDGVAGALAYLERYGCTARRRSGAESMVISTTGMVAASFTHAVNRNGDPARAQPRRRGEPRPRERRPMERLRPDGGSRHTDRRPRRCTRRTCVRASMLRSEWHGPLRPGPGGPPRSPVSRLPCSASSLPGAPTSAAISTRSVPARRRQGALRGRSPGPRRGRRPRTPSWRRIGPGGPVAAGPALDLAAPTGTAPVLDEHRSRP